MNLKAFAILAALIFFGVVAALLLGGKADFNLVMSPSGYPAECGLTPSQRFMDYKMEYADNGTEGALYVGMVGAFARRGDPPFDYDVVIVDGALMKSEAKFAIVDHAAVVTYEGARPTGSATAFCLVPSCSDADKNASQMKIGGFIRFRGHEIRQISKADGTPAWSGANCTSIFVTSITAG